MHPVGRLGDVHQVQLRQQHRPHVRQRGRHGHAVHGRVLRRAEGRVVAVRDQRGRADAALGPPVGLFAGDKDRFLGKWQQIPWAKSSPPPRSALRWPGAVDVGISSSCSSTFRNFGFPGRRRKRGAAGSGWARAQCKNTWNPGIVRQEADRGPGKRPRSRLIDAQEALLHLQFSFSSSPRTSVCSEQLVFSLDRRSILDGKSFCSSTICLRL